MKLSEKSLPQSVATPNVICVGAKLTILGSGSAGNASYVETDETRLLVDAGFSGRQICQRLATIGRVPENLTAILITHEQSRLVCFDVRRIASRAAAEDCQFSTHADDVRSRDGLRQ